MPETETSIEYSGDMTGMVLKSTTVEAFDAIPTPTVGGGIRSFRLQHTDGKYTLVKEEWNVTPNVMYSGDGTTSSEDILTHPDLESLSAGLKNKWQLWLQNPSNPQLGEWQPSTEPDATFAKLWGWYSAGIKTYLAPRVTIKHTTIEFDPPSLGIIGTIADPGGGFDFDGNFLVVGCSFQQEGDRWRVTYEYLGSQKGKNWDPVIYS